VLGGRTELAGQRHRIVRFGAVVAAGGALGAAILLLAPPGAFALAVPVLTGSAAVVVHVISASRWRASRSRSSLG
jgi:hypothetical protein